MFGKSVMTRSSALLTRLSAHAIALALVACGDSTSSLSTSEASDTQPSALPASDAAAHEPNQHAPATTEGGDPTEDSNQDNGSDASSPLPTVAEPADERDSSVSESPPTPGRDSGTAQRPSSSDAGVQPSTTPDDGALPDSPLAEPDASLPPTAPSTPALADAGADQCRREQTTTRPGGDAIDLGTFCDVVFVCADQQLAQAARDAAPAFECHEANAEFGCDFELCELFPTAADRRITSVELDQICALSVLLPDDAVIECRVYL